MKLMIFIGITIGGTLGGWWGAALLDGGNWLGLWSLFLSGVGSIAGVFGGYKAGKYLGL